MPNQTGSREVVSVTPVLTPGRTDGILNAVQRIAISTQHLTATLRSSGLRSEERRRVVTRSATRDRTAHRCLLRSQKRFKSLHAFDLSRFMPAAFYLYSSRFLPVRGDLRAKSPRRGDVSINSQLGNISTAVPCVCDLAQTSVQGGPDFRSASPCGRARRGISVQESSAPT